MFTVPNLFSVLPENSVSVLSNTDTLSPNQLNEASLWNVLIKGYPLTLTVTTGIAIRYRTFGFHEILGKYRVA
jgi:hypothetical protein